MADLIGRPKGKSSRMPSRKRAFGPSPSVLLSAFCFLRADHADRERERERACGRDHTIVADVFLPWRQESPLIDGVSQRSADPEGAQKHPKAPQSTPKHSKARPKMEPVTTFRT